MSHPKSLPSADEVRISPELAVACYRTSRVIFDAFIVWVELRYLNQALIGRGYLNGQLPYLETLVWLNEGGWSTTKVEELIRAGSGVFFGRPKPSILQLRSFKRVCNHFRVVPLSWRRVPLREFCKGRRSAVRLVMTLPPEDASPWERDKPRAKATRRANSGVPERTQFEDERRMGVRNKRNWCPNNEDDWEIYPLHQIGSTYRGFGLSSPVGRILHVQVAMLGTSCLKMGARKILRQRWPRRYFETEKSLTQALRRQDSQEGKGVPSGLAPAIIPRQVNDDPLYWVPRSDRMRLNVREWRPPSV